MNKSPAISHRWQVGDTEIPPPAGPRPQPARPTPRVTPPPHKRPPRPAHTSVPARHAPPPPPSPYFRRTGAEGRRIRSAAWCSIVEPFGMAAFAGPAKPFLSLNPQEDAKFQKEVAQVRLRARQVSGGRARGLGPRPAPRLQGRPGGPQTHRLGSRGLPAPGGFHRLRTVGLGRQAFGVVERRGASGWRRGKLAGRGRASCCWWTGIGTVVFLCRRIWETSLPGWWFRNS